MEIEKKQLYGCLKNLKYGCYIRRWSELVPAIKEDGMMPLKSSEYEIQIVNAVANITLTQTYQNPTEKFLEIQYCFPINPNACVYRLVASFANKRIQGIVKEKKEAQAQYKQAVKNGKQAALGTIDPNNSDILNLQVGNVGPKEIVKIEIVYLQELTLSSNIFYELHMTGTIYPRYMAHIPNEVIYRGFRDRAIQAKGQFFWNFTIKLRTSKKVCFAQSKSHKLNLLTNNDSSTDSQYTLDKQCLPNKDFVFTYTTQNFEEPAYVLGRNDMSSTAMISFIPKFCQLSINDAYQASLSGTPFETDIEHARGEYIFLLDRSGSMGGKRIEKAKEALVLFIKSLPEDIYFNVVSFGTKSKELFADSSKYNDKSINSAVKAVKEMLADMGGTEIYNPLANILTRKPIEGYPKHIFLLTDGAVSNTNVITDMVEANNKYSRVHTIGIGNGCSEQLVLECAEKGKGHHVFITDDQNPSEKIIQLLTDSLSPVISKVNVEFDKDVVESIIPNPNSLPYILKGQIVNFYINFKGQLDKKTSIKFSYEDSLNKHPYSSTIQIDPESPSESFIDRMGHFKKIQLLEDSYRKNTNIEECMYFVKKIDKRAEIVNLSTKHQILSSETAFISVEKELVDGKYEEVKSTGQIKMEIKDKVKKEEYEERNMVKKCKAPVPMMKMAMKSSAATLSSVSSRPMTHAWGIKMAESSRPQANRGVGIAQPRMMMAMKESKQMERSDRSGMVQKKKKKRVAKCEDYEQQEQQQCANIESEQKDSQIDIVIFSQLSDGSWKDVKLAEMIFGAAPIQLLLREENNIGKFNSEWIITCLMVSWIQKYHKSKQYSLVVKKAMNFLKRETPDVELLAEYCKQITI